MAILSKSEYLNQINTLFPDQSSQAISPSDLRTMFVDLGDSINSLLSGVNLYSNNFKEENRTGSSRYKRTIIIGRDNLQKLEFVGRETCDNIAIGYNVLKQNYDGKENVSIGINTLDCNLYGSLNTALGHYALTSNLQGSGNTALGYLALSDNKQGNFNVGVGYGAGYYINQYDNYKLFIGAHPGAVSGCVTNYDDGPNPLIYGDMDSRRMGVNVKYLHPHGVLQTSGDITPSLDYNFNLGNANTAWSSVNELVYFSGGKVGIGTDSPSGVQGILTVDGNVVPNIDSVYSLGVENLRWDGYFNDILVSGRASINNFEYNTLTECLYECTTLHLGSSGLCDDGDWAEASKVCGYLSDAGIDGAGFIAHASGTSYIRDYSWLFRSSDQNIECLEEDSVYSRSHWESNVSIKTLPGRHVATDRILGDSKLALVKQSGCQGIFLTTNSPDKVHVAYERDLDADYPYFSGVDVNFLGDSGVNDNYIVSFGSPGSGIEVGTRYTTRVSGDPHGFGFIYHDHKNELNSNNQPKDRLSLHIYDSGNVNPVLEAVTVMRTSGELGNGLVGVTNVSYADNTEVFNPETIFNIYSDSEADLRVSSSGKNEVSLQLMSNGNKPASGIEVSYNPIDNNTYFRSYDDIDTYTQAIEISHTTNDVQLTNGRLEVSGNVTIGPTAYGMTDPLIVSLNSTNSGTIAIKEQAVDPSTTTDFGKLYVKEKIAGGQTQSLYFMDDGGNIHNMIPNPNSTQDGLLYGDANGNTFGGWFSPATRPVAGAATENTALGYSALSGISTGDQNTAVGFKAGEATETGVNNTYLGHGAFSGVDGSYNTIVGWGNNVSSDVDYNISLGTDLTSQTGNYVLQIGVTTPVISGLVGPNKRLYLAAQQEVAVESESLNLREGDLNLFHDAAGNNLLQFTYGTSGGREVADTNFVDNANNDRVDGYVAFNFVDGDGDSRVLLHLDHQADPMTNEVNYFTPSPTRPYAKLDGDLLLRGAIRFANGFSLETSSGIASIGGTGIRYEYDEVTSSGEFHLDFTDLFDVSNTGLLDTQESYLPVEIASGLGDMVAKISIDDLGEYISSGLDAPSLVVDNCNVVVANNPPLIQETLNSGTVFIGCNVGSAATGWLNTIMIGSEAGSNATTPNPSLAIDTASIFIGHNAGNNADSIDNGLFIGTNAGKNSASATDSVFIGQNAGLDSNFSYSLGIGQNALRGVVNSTETGSNNIEIVVGLDDNQRILYAQDVSDKIHIQNVIAGDTNDRKLSIGDAVLDPEAPLSVRKDSLFQGHVDTPSGFMQTWYCDDEFVWGVSCSGFDFDDFYHRSGSGLLSGILGVSGWAANTFNAGGSYSWTVSDGSNTETVGNTTQINWVGSKGVETSYNDGTNNLTITADGLSGWALETIINSGIAVSGWADGTFSTGGGGMTSFNVGDGLTNRGSITNDETLFVSGISGINVSYNAVDQNFVVDPIGISGWAEGSFALTVKEADGSPSVSDVNTIVVSNGTLTDDGGGQVTITTGGGGGMTSFDVGDGVTNRGTITNGETLFVSGISGINVSYNSVDQNFVIDPIGISGWATSTIIDSGIAVSGWAAGTFGGGVGGTYTAGSGLTLVGTEFNTAGSGNFNALQIRKTSYDFAAPVDSGLLVVDSGDNSFIGNVIVNSGGYLSAPYYGSGESDAFNNLTVMKTHSGSFAFAGAYPRVTDGVNFSPEPMIEGFVSGLTGSHGQSTFNIEAPTDFQTPTSGYLKTRNNTFSFGGDEVIVNRDKSLAISGGDYVVATFINGEYRPIYVSCSGCL